jgi:hypothetical protein
MTAYELEAKMEEISDQGKALFAAHRDLLHQARNWLIAMRSLEAVKTYVNGATYAPREET